MSDDPENLFEAMLLDPAAIGGDGGSFRQMSIATRARQFASLRDIAAGDRRSVANQRAE